MMIWMKSTFSKPRKNVKIKHIESYKQKEKYEANIVLLQTLYEINLNISLQWWIISQSRMGNSIKS